jgi:hypothetical protein
MERPVELAVQAFLHTNALHLVRFVLSWAWRCVENTERAKANAPIVTEAVPAAMRGNHGLSPSRGESGYGDLNDSIHGDLDGNSDRSAGLITIDRHSVFSCCSKRALVSSEVFAREPWR